MAEKFEVNVASTTGLRQEARARKHVIVADAPPSNGGEDAGLDPFEILLSALGACMSMTCTMYARRKGWKLTRVGVKLTHEKVDDRDKITRDVTFEGELSPEERTRLLDIANKCPVHKTLTGGKIDVTTREVPRT